MDRMIVSRFCHQRHRNPEIQPEGSSGRCSSFVGWGSGNKALAIFGDPDVLRGKSDNILFSGSRENTYKKTHMEIVGLIFTVIGLIIALVFGIQILILAFKESVLWGLGSMFVPFVGLIFIIKFWEKTKKPFLYYLTCIPFFIIGSILASSQAS